jgi:flagellar L-ring protein FlgH
MMKRILLVVWLVGVTITSQAENLYQEGNFRALTSDRRAYRIGDVLTVLVVENSSATATADTKTDRSNDAGVRLTTPNRQRNYALGLEEDFDGRGKSARSGRLLAQLSVSIVGIDSNGDLRVQGEQLLKINDEKQSIHLEGRVRPVDISELNTVPSNRLADAKITYVGDGVLAESQRKGWLSRVLTYLGLI